MRLQAPQLGQPTGGSLGPHSILGPGCTLPDTFGVIHIGEVFTAYLGVLNADDHLPIRNLAVTAQLQTPSRRWPLPCGLEGVGSAGAGGSDANDDDEGQGPIDVSPGSGVDAIVSRPLEEIGQHILGMVTNIAKAQFGLFTHQRVYQLVHPAACIRTDGVAPW